MSVPRFKRRPSGLDYVDNAFELQKEIMNLASKLSARWARIYQQPVDKLACLQALERKLMDMIRILYMNPSKCFSRKNGKNYTTSEATKMLDNKLEGLGVQFAKQYDLLNGVLESDKKKYNKIKNRDLTDKEIIEILVSKSIQLVFG